MWPNLSLRCSNTFPPSLQTPAVTTRDPLRSSSSPRALLLSRSGASAAVLTPPWFEDPLHNTRKNRITKQQARQPRVLVEPKRGRLGLEICSNVSLYQVFYTQLSALTLDPAMLCSHPSLHSWKSRRWEIYKPCLVAWNTPITTH